MFKRALLVSFALFSETVAMDNPIDTQGPKEKVCLIDLSWQTDDSMIAAVQGFGYTVCNQAVKTNVSLRDPETGTCIRTLETAHASHARFAPVGTMLAAMNKSLMHKPGHEDVIELWDAKNGDLVKNLSLSWCNDSRNFAWNPDGTRLATTTTQAVEIYDIASGKIEQKCPLFVYTNNHTIDWSSNNKIVVQNRIEGVLEIIDPTNNTNEIVPICQYYNSVCWSPNGKKIWLSHDAASANLPIDTKESKTIPRSPAKNASWLADSRFVATCSYSSIAIIDSDAATIKYKYYQNEMPTQVTWCPTGKYIAAIMNGNKLKIVDTQSLLKELQFS